MITKNYIKIFLYIDYKNYVTIMWSWNQFRNLPKNQGLSAQEQARLPNILSKSAQILTTILKYSVLVIKPFSSW